MAAGQDAVGALSPQLRAGERVSALAGSGDDAREVLGFVTALDDTVLGVIDRHGTVHELPRRDVVALRRVPIARGRRPEATPRDLLDALAGRAGASGTPWVARISDLLSGRTPPRDAPGWGEWATLGATRARFEGEWVTVGGGDQEAWVAAAWWGTRMGARSVQVRAADAATQVRLERAGFTRLP